MIDHNNRICIEKGCDKLVIKKMERRRKEKALSINNVSEALMKIVQYQ